MLIAVIFGFEGCVKGETFGISPHGAMHMWPTSINPIWIWL